MRITNQTPANAVENSTNQTPRTDGAASGFPAPHLSPQVLTTVPAQSSSLAPSYELLNLNATLRQLPPIREDVVADTIRRLTSGQLGTPDALDHTASAILGGAPQS